MSGFHTYEEFKKYVNGSGIAKELAQQAEWTYKNYVYADAKYVSSYETFGITPSGSMNPLSIVSKCIHEKCAEVNVKNFITTSIVYADVSYISYNLTAFFAKPRTLKDFESESIFISVKALKSLEALLRSGIVRLRRPYSHCCRKCYETHLATVKDITGSIINRVIGEEIIVRIRKSGRQHSIGIHSELLSIDDNHSIFFPLEQNSLKYFLGGDTKKLPKAAIDYIITKLTGSLIHEMMSVMLDMESATYTNSALVAESRLETLYINELRREVVKFRDIYQWESERSIKLPWVSELTTNELLRLREEASDALPKLRTLLSQKLNNVGEDQVKNIVEELRAQVTEVENEFTKLSLPKEARYRVGMSTLAASFVVYGLIAGATGSPGAAATSIAGLLATAAHLRGTEREQDAKVAGLKCMPAFVLLKAKSLLQRR
jgi:hypothetical protein